MALNIRSIEKKFQGLKGYDEWLYKLVYKRGEYELKVNCKVSGVFVIKFIEYELPYILEGLEEYFITGVYPLTVYWQPYTTKRVQDGKFEMLPVGGLITSTANVHQGELIIFNDNQDEMMEKYRKVNGDFGFNRTAHKK
jgi:hypothetical protein